MSPNAGFCDRASAERPFVTPPEASLCHHRVVVLDDRGWEERSLHLPLH
jgi:hypothetical protein